MEVKTIQLLRYYIFTNDIDKVNMILKFPSVEMMAFQKPTCMNLSRESLLINGLFLTKRMKAFTSAYQQPLS